MIRIGQALRPQGNRGEVKIRSFSSTPEDFFAFLEVPVFIGREEDFRPEPVEVEKARIHKGFVVLKLKGVDSISDAEELRNSFLLIRREDRPDPGKNAWYYDDLAGLELWDRNTGSCAGTVEEVKEMAGNVLLSVCKEDGKTFLVPFARGLVHRVDMEEKRLEMSLPEGLDEI